jgi:hypothetical protein
VLGIGRLIFGGDWVIESAEKVEDTEYCEVE